MSNEKRKINSTAVLPGDHSMLAKRIIPCLDVDRGRVVKGIRFVSLVDAGDAVEQARGYDAEGADELTFLDITASSDKRAIIMDLVRRVADEVFIPLTVGGGLGSSEDIQAVLGAGADKVSLFLFYCYGADRDIHSFDIFG